MSGLREEIRLAVQQNNLATVETLVKDNPRALRHIVGLTYHADPEIRSAAAKGVGLSARHQPKLVQKIVRRFVWAMNDESGTNALTAPAVLEAIARETPELLLPMVPDLVRLAGDPGLREGIAATLRVVRDKCPGEIDRRLADALNEQLKKTGP